jgi:hypothetical protein
LIDIFFTDLDCGMGMEMKEKEIGDDGIENGEGKPYE